MLADILQLGLFTAAVGALVETLEQEEVAHDLADLDHSEVLVQQDDAEVGFAWSLVAHLVERLDRLRQLLGVP